MIPAMGIMIGAYIILRALEIIGRPENGFVSHGARGLLIFVSLVVILISVVSMAQIGISAGQASEILRGLPR